MRLDLGFVDIRDVRFGPHTVIEDNVLSIDREELTSLLEQVFRLYRERHTTRRREE